LLPPSHTNESGKTLAKRAARTRNKKDFSEQNITHMAMILLLLAAISTASALSLTNGLVNVYFGTDFTLSGFVAPSEAGKIEYIVGGDAWSASVAPTQGAPATVLGPGVCTQRSAIQDDTHVFVTFGGCSPYRVIATYELRPGWTFVTKSLLIQSEFEDVSGALALSCCAIRRDLRMNISFSAGLVGPIPVLSVYPQSPSYPPAHPQTSFFVTSIEPAGFLRFSQKDTTGDAPFVATNPFDSGKHIAAFQRFASTASSVFVTVQNPFTLFTVVPNRTSACTPGVDHPYGDEPGMPLPSGTRDPGDCALLCSSDPACKAFAFIDTDCRGSTAPVCYLKASVTPTASVPDCICSGLRTADDEGASAMAAIRASYAPNIGWDAFPRRSPGISSDALVIGAANLSAYHTQGTEVNTGERDAFAACVEEFLMDAASRTNSTVKINVAWVRNFM
jgi:hypothetical protein